MKKHSFVAASAAILAVAISSTARAEDKVKVVPILTNLLNPSGVAAEPGTPHILVSDMTDKGTGRILCAHDEGSQADYESVVKGFGKDVYGKGPMYDVGPLGLAFAGKGKLVVGGGDKVDGEEVVYVVDMPKHGESTTADKATKLGPIKPGPDSPKGEGNFFGVAVTADALFVTSNGDDTKGWILKAELKDGKFGELKPFIATKPLVNVDAPAAITVDSHGHLVVGQMGEVNVAGDSLLTFYDAKTGKLITSIKTELSDIVGLAYHPVTHKLYAVDFSWADPTKGGLYRLDVSGEEKDATVKAEKLCSLDKPAAMCFTAEGKLYVAEFGTKPEGEATRPGRLVRIDGEL